MRWGFQGLSAQVQTVLEQQPLSGHVFVFRGRRGDIMKVLWFDGDGAVSAGQTARTRTLHLAAGDERIGVSESCAAVDAARRDRLESPHPDSATAVECLRFRPVFMRVFFC